MLSESLDFGNNGTIDKSTTYAWNQTQQATKTVTVNSVPSVIQTFAYNMRGSMSSVTTTNYTSGVASSKSRVDYDYNASGIRVKASDFAFDSQTSNFTLQTSTDYLIDESNFTGYAQSIAETTRNASGQTTKRIVYTFGTDEITQTTYEYSSSGLQPTVSSLSFGHDAHSSVRVLFDVASAIAQAYTYAAYGELLAIHNGLAQQVLASGTSGLESAALTRMLYNGEAFDSRIGQLYLRARWYEGHRFTTLDPFFGNSSDPLSFNKYGFVHGDPVGMTDPTGLFGLAGFAAGFSISSSIRSIKMETDLLAFDIATTLIQGIEEGMSGEQILLRFFGNQLLGFGLGVAVSKVGSVITDLFDNGITIALPGSTTNYRARTSSEAFFIFNNRRLAPTFRYTNDVAVHGNPAPPTKGDSIQRARSAFSLSEQKDLAVKWQKFAKSSNATDIRFDQSQIGADGTLVGINRPDIQMTLDPGTYILPNGSTIALDKRTRVYVELDDLRTSGRGPNHMLRISANDPAGLIVLQTTSRSNGLESTAIVETIE